MFAENVLFAVRTLTSRRNMTYFETDNFSYFIYAPNVNCFYVGKNEPFQKYMDILY